MLLKLGEMTSTDGVKLGAAYRRSVLGAYAIPTHLCVPVARWSVLNVEKSLALVRGSMMRTASALRGVATAAHSEYERLSPSAT